MVVFVAVPSLGPHATTTCTKVGVVTEWNGERQSSSILRGVVKIFRTGYIPQCSAATTLYPGPEEGGVGVIEGAGFGDRGGVVGAKGARWL